MSVMHAHPEKSYALQASDINALFGFRLECTERLGEQQGIWAWKRLNSLFNWLPLAATIEDRVLCMHGGELIFGQISLRGSSKRVLRISGFLCLP